MSWKCYSLSAFLILSALLSFTAAAQTSADKRARLAASATPGAAVPSGACQLGSASQDLDANNVRARLYNTGGLFWNGSGNVYTVPKDGEAEAVFASGLWVGGLTADGERRFAGTAYGPFEYWPGPLDENGNPPVDCTPFDRIYKITRDDLERLDQAGTAGADILEWPWRLGAPVEDGDGDPDNYDLAAGDRPSLFGDQTLWWVMNDAGGVKAWSETAAIGLEVQVTAYAFDRPDAFQNTTFYRYRLLHKGDQALHDAYVALWVDPDLGNAADDFIGSDPDRDLGFVYNGTDFDQGFDGYGDAPPALGYVILEGPHSEDDGIDNDGDGAVDEDGERLGMTNFIYYIGDSTLLGNPEGETAGPYRYMQGLWLDGTPLTVGGTGYGGTERTHFAFPDMPPAFWSEENRDGRGTRNTPADRRFLISMGPFTFAPGDVQDFTFAIVWSRNVDRLLSVAKLKRDVDLIRGVTEEPLPAPPTQTPALVSPFDGASRVVEQPALTWRSLGDSLWYSIQIDTTDAFETPLSLLVRHEATVRPFLENGRTYYWRVRAATVGGAGPWSDVRSFSTIRTTLLPPGFSALETVANANGVLDPPVGASADFAGFPSLRPDPSQQAGEGEWMIHVADDGTRSGYDDFLEVVSHAGLLWPEVGFYDYEIRFTEDGSWTVDPFASGEVFQVPFELWRIGIDTPDDPSDDVRLIPYVRDLDWTSVLDTDGLPAFNLVTQHSLDAASGPAYNDGYPVSADHSASGGSNDPQTDWIAWHLPHDETPGEAGYRGWEADLLARADPASIYRQADRPVMERMVFINWNGGRVDAGVYDQAVPETGTVFRLRTLKSGEVLYETALSGLHVVQPALTGASGHILARASTLHLEITGSFQELSGPVTDAFLYEGDPGRDGLPLLALTPTPQADGTGGLFEADLNALGIPPRALFEGRLYVVLHTARFPEGELRGQLLPMPNAAPESPTLLAPEDGILIKVRARPDEAVDVAWLPAGDENGNLLAYLWQLATDANFSDVVFAQHAGPSTSMQVTIGALAEVLDRLGVEVGEEIGLYHRVVASDGSLLQAGPPFAVRLRLGTVTATEDDGLPERFALQGNYPNPFNPATTLVFDLPAAADVTVAVYDVLGRRVLALPPRPMEAGAARQLRLDGSALASGMYVYRITAESATRTWRATGRLVLMK